MVNTAVAAALNLGRAGVSFLTTIAVARYLGPTGRGEIALITNVATLMALVAGSGTIAAMVRLVATGYCSPDLFYSDGAAASLVVSLPAAAATWLICVQSVNGSAAGAAALGAAALSVHGVLVQAATLHNRLWSVTWTTLFGVVLYAIATVTSCLAGTATPTNNSWVWALSTVAALGLLIAATRREFDMFERSMVANLLRSSVGPGLAAVAMLAVWRIDVAVVQWRRGFRELGLYSVAVGLAEVVIMVGLSVRSAVLPHIDAVGHKRMIQIISRVTRVSLFGLLVLSVVLGVAAGPFITLVFGRQFDDVVTPFRLLLPGVTAFVVQFALHDFLIGAGRTRALIWLGGTGVVVNVVLNATLLTSHSFVVASIVASATYALMLAGCVRLFSIETGCPATQLLVVQRADLETIVAALRGGRDRRMTSG